MNMRKPLNIYNPHLSYNYKIPIIDVDLYDWEIEEHVILKNVSADCNLCDIVKMLNDRGHEMVEETKCNMFVTNPDDDDT